MREVREQAFMVTREWLSGPLRGARSMYCTRSTLSVGFQGRSAQGRYLVVLVEPVTVPAGALKEGGR
jgi:hypothetical protein